MAMTESELLCLRLSGEVNTILQRYDSKITKEQMSECLLALVLGTLTKHKDMNFFEVRMYIDKFIIDMERDLKTALHRFH